MINADEEIQKFVEQMVEAGLTVEKIIKAFIRENPLDWRIDAKIIPDYMPRYPRADTKPTVQVWYQDHGLRYSGGPRQGFFWDAYGDDFINVGLAFRALMEAPPPPCLWMEKAHHARFARSESVSTDSHDLAQRCIKLGASPAVVGSWPITSGNNLF